MRNCLKIAVAVLVFFESNFGVCKCDTAHNKDAGCNASVGSIDCSKSEEADDVDREWREHPLQTKEEALSLGYPIHDDIMFCEECKKTYSGDCPIHGALYTVENMQIPFGTMNRARLSLPPSLVVKMSSIPNAGTGIWSVVDIPARTRFGPYEGIVRTVEPEDATYAWTIYNDDKAVMWVDAIDPSQSNWIRYVNSARNEEELNMIPYQIQGQVYYMTFKPVPPDTELLVWYGRKYADWLELDKDFEPRIPFDGGTYAPVCPDWWISFNNHCYFYSQGDTVTGGIVSWYEAQELCWDADSYLAVITSSTENVFLMNNKPTATWIGWIGLNNIEDEHKPVWDGTNEAFNPDTDFNSYWDGQTSVDKRCFASLFTFWNDFKCNIKLNFICEKLGTKDLAFL